MSTVSPTSSSPSSTESDLTLSFSTGGGGGTSIFDGWTPCSEAVELSTPSRDGISGMAGEFTGEGNLNSLFIVPLRLLRFESALVVRSNGTSSSSSASTVGSNELDLTLASGVAGECGWLTNVEELSGGVVRDAGGIEER